MTWHAQMASTFTAIIWGTAIDGSSVRCICNESLGDANRIREGSGLLRDLTAQKLIILRCFPPRRLESVLMALLW